MSDPSAELAFDKDALRAAMSDANLNEPIYLIESPSADDLFNGRNEGDSLARTLSLGGIETTYYLAANDLTFEAAINDIAIKINHRTGQSNSMPFVHISAHGDDDGFYLTDGDIIPWRKLTKLLDDINNMIGYLEFGPPYSPKVPRINLALSSCSAFTNYRAHLQDVLPFQVMIGPNQNIGWCQALIGFTTFYYQSFVRREPFTNALVSMNAASASSQAPVFERHFDAKSTLILQQEARKRFPLPK